MTIQKIKMLFVGLTTMFLVTSCISDADKIHENPKFSGFGDVIKNGEEYKIVLDTYDTVKVLNQSFLNLEEVKVGGRVYFMSELLKMNNKQPFGLLTVNVYRVDSIEVKQPILLSEVVDDDALGMEKIELKQIMVSGTYLTTKFKIRMNDKNIKHTISFVVDDTKPLEEGVLNIKMRHNKNEDALAMSREYMVACNILEFQKTAPNGRLKVNVYYDSLDGENRVITTYWQADDEWYLVNQ